jgi:hypothetical protein
MQEAGGTVNEEERDKTRPSLKDVKTKKLSYHIILDLPSIQNVVTVIMAYGGRSTLVFVSAPEYSRCILKNKTGRLSTGVAPSSDGYAH